MKLFKVLMIISFSIVLIWGYYLYINPIFFTKKEVYVPDLVGLKETDAIAILEDMSLGYTIKYVEGTSSDISYTRPKANSLVKVGFPVELYVFNNEELHYESFVGLLFESNIDLIEEYCKRYLLTYDVTYEINNDIPEGVIISQNHSKDDIVCENDVLSFIVSASDNYITMPRLIGLNVYDAISILNDSSLVFNIIYYNSLIDSNIVLSQSVKEGKVIKKGNNFPIDIYVSKGLPVDLSCILVEEFVKTLEYIPYKYDIIYMDSNLEKKVLKIIAFYENEELCYKIYMSR